MAMRFPSMAISVWSIFVQLFLLIITSSSLSQGGNEVDRMSLLAIKAEINDTLGILSSWNKSLHFCQWHGITCGSRHQRVTMLDLQSSQLKGRLSPHIGNLSFLRTLHLQNNRFSHIIPPEVGRLFRLRELVLDNNSFTGDIPINISRCTKLQFLRLAGNALTGKIPIEIGSLSNLRVLGLVKNSLVGQISPSFGNLSSLFVLTVEQNHLNGDIPNSLGHLKRLRFLGLGVNNFTGTIPPSIYNLSTIKYFSVLMNDLHGTLPSGLGHSVFPNIEKFFFHFNRFSGPIPITISNASNLVDFGISENNFMGKVPSLARLAGLNWLGLDSNNLGDNKVGDLDFLTSLVNCTNLQILEISNNNFGGVLPESISNLSTKLTRMGMGGNPIRGNIPPGIGNLINLEGLSFEADLLTGIIPNSLGQLRKLYHLYLDSNELSGTIPSSLGNLTSLGRLLLYSNNLQGSIPQSLGDCKNLLLLVLAQNNLSGPIPKQVMGLAPLSEGLDLANNQLTGPIPMEVAKLVNLVILSVSGNKLFGEIPQSLGNCINLRNLYLSGNLLHGTLNESLSSLRVIEDFRLSRNNFSGRIPSYLESFQFLKNLDLSFNDFEGAVPLQGVFKNTSAVSIIGNMLLCGGIPQLRLPICVSKRSKQGISPRLKLILSVTCGAIGLISVFLFVLLCRLRKARVLKSTSGSSLGVSLLKVSYGDLLKATDGFSSANVIGVGSFGSVYKGILNQHEEKVVAVKVLNLQNSRASKSFIAECEALRNIRHRNLVKLLTACSSIDFQGNDFKALVYEFMLNGSLEEWLHSRFLNLTQRLNIAIDVASTLDYLQSQCEMPIIHCDLKPSNVLLDGDMTARVGDFGLARCLPDAFCPLPSQESTSSAIKGSIGYTAPEYGTGSEVSTYGDVYSFGILLLEMLTSKRPTNEMFKDGVDLHKYVVMALPDRIAEICEPLFCTNATYDVDDAEMDQRRGVDEECLISIAKIGVACSAKMPRERMDIRNVVAELCRIRDVRANSPSCKP